VAVLNYYSEHRRLFQRLDLSNNKITKIPSTFSLLVKLEELYVMSNNLESLPENLSPATLRVVKASNNNINRLPESIRFCVNLEVLHMDGNPLDAMFWKVVSQLRRLRDLEPANKAK